MIPSKKWCYVLWSRIFSTLKEKCFCHFKIEGRPWVLLMSLGTHQDLFQKLQCSTRQWLDIQLDDIASHKNPCFPLIASMLWSSRKWDKRNVPLYFDLDCNGRNLSLFYHITRYPQGQWIWNQEILLKEGNLAKFLLHKERQGFIHVLCVFEFLKMDVFQNGLGSIL